jgi:NTP pyrophosphatase (non-canonical NTP hydrolase)
MQEQGEEEMNFAEYQEEAWTTLNMEADIEIMAALGLAGEAGEYAEHVKKVRFHNHDEDNEKALLELGDVLWYLSAAARQRGLTLEQIAIANIAKLKARYPNKFDAARSRVR